MGLPPSSQSPHVCRFYLAHRRPEGCLSSLVNLFDLSIVLSADLFKF
jgi:hypothetical protein